jgi:formamidopyrimidine-DNA glycosylase
MPELPEVETVVRTLRPKLLGRKINAVDLRRADILQPAGFDLTAQLTGRTIRSIHRRGKRILFTLDGEDQFYVHLGMSGQLTVEWLGTAVRNHTHLIIHTDAGELRFRDPRRFGGVWWVGKSSSHDDDIGPEPLTITPKQLAARLAKTTRAIKVALLDQKLIAGLGNIYVDESLFAAGIHPLTPSHKLTKQQIGRLNRAIKATLRRAIRLRGSTLRDYRDANGSIGDYQHRHQVYDRAHQPCRRCGKPISRIVLGGRSTHFCAKCQKR